MSAVWTLVKVKRASSLCEEAGYSGQSEKEGVVSWQLHWSKGQTKQLRCANKDVGASYALATKGCLLQAVVGWGQEGDCSPRGWWDHVTLSLGARLPGVGEVQEHWVDRVRGARCEVRVRAQRQVMQSEGMGD